MKQDIITCSLRPGSSLTESELARRYALSRTPVREACRRLDDEGLIKIVPFRGYFVAPLTVSEFHQLQEMQLITDPAAAALAARRASAVQVSRLRACARYEYRTGDRKSYFGFLQRNRSLHVGIAESTGNQHLVEVVRTIHTKLMRYFYLGLSLDAYGGTLVAEHCAIVEAIRRHRAEEARSRAAEHVMKTMKRSAKLFLSPAAQGIAVPDDSDSLRGADFQALVGWEELAPKRPGRADRSTSF